MMGELIHANTEMFGKVPAWVATEVNRARAGLGIHPAWYISIAISDKPHGKEEHDAAVYCEPEYMQAGIEIKEEVAISENLKHRELIWHEVAHVLLSPMMDMARQISNQLPDEELAKFAFRQMENAEEQAIVQLTNGLRVGGYIGS